MDPVTSNAFVDELNRIAKHAAKIKSNDRFPPRTKTNIKSMMDMVHELPDEHRAPALAFAEKATPSGLFDILHSIRRWYTGQTMSGKLIQHRELLSGPMKLEASDAVGAYRGFKVSKDDPLAKSEVGQQLTLPVTRNRGVSSWSTTEAPTNRFSGGGKGKIGLIVKLVDGNGVKPILAPPTHTEGWFNELYRKVIGKSFRPTEGEYLIAAPSVKVEVVRVKK
jgi:hypothetical protein